jgi:hypothetical protein
MNFLDLEVEIDFSGIYFNDFAFFKLNETRFLSLDFTFSLLSEPTVSLVGSSENVGIVGIVT